MALKANPSGTGGEVKYRLYDSAIITMKKLLQLVHHTVTRSSLIPADLGEINPVGFQSFSQ